MQFKKVQRAELKANWGEGSWFYQNLGQPARDVVERAYGLRECSPRQRAASQEALTLVMSVFARRIGAEKSQATHALLSGSIEGLLAALGRKTGARFSVETIREAWVSSFREVLIATI